MDKFCKNQKNECDYKERDRKLKKNVNQINDDDKMTKIVRELTKNQEHKVASAELDQKNQSIKSQKAILDSTKENKEFNMIKETGP